MTIVFESFAGAEKKRERAVMRNRNAKRGNETS